MSNLPPRNPIYFFVKDLINAKDKLDKPLEEIAQQRWERMSEPEMLLFREHVMKATAYQTPDNSHISIAESNKSLSESSVSINRELDCLGALFGNDPQEHHFTVASTNMFVNTHSLCIPAEIGLVRFSFLKGVMDSFTSMLNPGPIPDEHVSEAIRSCEQHHKIPHRGLKYPNRSCLLRVVHQMTHGVGDGEPNAPEEPIGWVFIEDDEFEATCATLDKMAEDSSECNPDLTWNLHYIKLSSVFRYMKNYFKLEPVEEDQFAFKTTMYTFADLCGHHLKTRCANCALSKAHRYCYILAAEFCPRLGISRIAGCHKPLKTNRNVF